MNTYDEVGIVWDNLFRWNCKLTISQISKTRWKTRDSWTITATINEKDVVDGDSVKKKEKKMNKKRRKYWNTLTKFKFEWEHKFSRRPKSMFHTTIYKLLSMKYCTVHKLLKHLLFVWIIYSKNLVMLHKHIPYTLATLHNFPNVRMFECSSVYAYNTVKFNVDPYHGTMDSCIYKFALFFSLLFFLFPSPFPSPSFYLFLCVDFRKLQMWFSFFSASLYFWFNVNF